MCSYQRAPFSLMLFRAVHHVEALHPSLHLAVPLRVDAKAAQNWDEAHWEEKSLKRMILIEPRLAQDFFARA